MWAILALPCTAWAAPPVAKPAAVAVPPSLPVEALRPGLKGYGLTVVRGSKVERFQIEVIGVLNQALPGQDLILIRCSGLNLEHSGVVAGMSGSPIYVQDPQRGDLLIGALSYGFAFNKDPVAGVTPIAAMLPELDRPVLPPPANQKLRAAPAATQASAPPAKAQLHDGSVLTPVGIPLVFSGFDGRVVQEMKAELDQLGLGPVHVAASGVGGGLPASRRKASPPFEPGSAISLSLVRGDMSVSGVGTVTWVRGDRFIAFGHPFKGLGQVHLPVGNAEVQWILASQSSSFKMANPLADIGVLDQDRQAAVAGRTGIQAEMVPARITVRGKERGTSQVWNVELTDQPLFFPLAASMVAANAVRVSEPVAESLDIALKLRVAIDGHEPIELNEVISGLAGMGNVSEVGALVGALTKAITFNGFERLRVNRIDIEMDVSETRNLAFLEWVRAPSEEVAAGEPIPLRVGLMRPNQPEPLAVVDVTLPPLPAELAGTTITVQVGPEKGFPVEAPDPKHVREMLDQIRTFVPRSRLAAVVPLTEPSLMLRGARLTHLPIGVRDELQGHPVAMRAGKELLRASVATPWALSGTANVKLRVRPAK